MQKSLARSFGLFLMLLALVALAGGGRVQAQADILTHELADPSHAVEHQTQLWGRFDDGFPWTFGGQIVFTFTDSTAWSFQSSQQWGYGFPAGNGQCITADSYHGPAKFNETLDLSNPAWQTFGPANVVVNVQGSNGASDTISGMKSANVQGTTAYEAFTYDGTHYLPCPSVDVRLVNAGDASRYSGAPTASRNLGGAAHAYLLFGEQQGQKTDDPYAPGMASSNYYFVSQYKGTSVQSEIRTGSAWPGKGTVAVFSVDAQGNPTTGHAEDTEDQNLPHGGCTAACAAAINTTGDGGTGGTGGTGTGVPQSITDFFTSFWDTLKADLASLFEPDQAHIDEVHTAASSLFAWGPFSVPAQVKAVWDATLNAAPPSVADPYYWWLPLSPWDDSRNVSGAPSNSAGLYNSLPAGMSAGQVADAPDSSDAVAASARWAGFFPSGLDCSHFSREIVAGRGVEFWALWAGFFLILYTIVKPRVQL